MDECSVVRERIPDLIVESLAPDAREHSHRHIESCSACADEWRSFRATWSALGQLPEVVVPAAVRQHVLAHASRSSTGRSNVVPIGRRFVPRLAQAAAIAVLVGGSFFAGRETTDDAPPVQPPAAAAMNPLFSISESAVVPAASVNPDIQGRPDIRNVRFEHKAAGEQASVSFDMTSHVTITGRPDDPSLVRLLSYVLQDPAHPTTARASAIEWVKDTYKSETSSPELITALGSVLKNDSHEGVRLKAVEALTSTPPAAAGEAREALVHALRNDPNPAVRIKAIEALMNLNSAGAPLDPASLDSLRQTASRQDENLYVRVKAAEALGQMNL